MADLLHVIGEALSAYWLSPLPLTVLAVCIASIGTLLYVFVTNARNPKLRVSLLTGLYALSIFFWAFVATSLVLCASQARMVAYARNGVSLAVFGAVFAGLATTSMGTPRSSGSSPPDSPDRTSHGCSHTWTSSESSRVCLE